MTQDRIFDPVGTVAAQDAAGAARARSASGKPVVGLIDNSKPNVGLFLRTIEDALRASGDYEVVSVTKPRSAAACPELESLAAQCNFVVNAVAD